MFCVYLTGVSDRCYIISDVVRCITTSSEGFCVYLTGVSDRCYIISDVVRCITTSSEGAFVNSEDDMHWYTVL